MDQSPMLNTRRREFIALGGGGGLLLATKARRASAQQAERMRQIGVLMGTSDKAALFLPHSRQT
jgi:hypothetical protein